MKKVIHALAALVFVLICYFVFVSPANAATIYTNSFSNTNLSDFAANGSCNDSQGYLTASSGTCDLNWNTVINYGCVSVDIYNATGNANVNPLSIGTNFIGANNTDFVGGLNFGGGPNIVYLFDNEIGGTIHPYPSGLFEPLSGWHHFDLCNDGLKYNLYYDSSLIISYTPSIHASWNGLNFQVGSENELKNLVISDGYVTTSNLNVPLLKQTDPLWGSQTYDSANKWAPLHSTIGEWGCAETSAAMILKYYKIDKLPDGTALDPGTLNSWLKSQPDGYVGNGLVNWLAISRLTKQAKSQNPTFSYDALEYKRHSGFDASLLTADLQVNQPDILEEPGHFVVGKGTSGATFDINDPYYDRQDLNNTAYNNSFLSLGRYIPSHTDLSYIMFTISPDFDITVSSSSGQKAGGDVNNPLAEINNSSYFLQNEITDPVTLQTSDGLKFLTIQYPQDGSYSLTVTNPNASSKKFTLGVFEYDSDGNVQTQAINGTTKDGSYTTSISYQNSSTRGHLTCDPSELKGDNSTLHKVLCEVVHFFNK